MADKARREDYEEARNTVLTQMSQDHVRLSRRTAWNFVYRYVMAATGDAPHIVESNELAKEPWKSRAEKVSGWLRQNLAPNEGTLSPADLAARIDRAWEVVSVNRNKREGKPPSDRSRPNVTGKALQTALTFLIGRLCHVRPLEERSIHRLRGFELARAEEVKQLDLALFPGDFRIFMSCIWTTRKDRLGADLNDAAFVHRRRPDVAVLLVVNEFHLPLIRHLATAPQVDRVYHVCREALLSAHEPDMGQTLNQLHADRRKLKDYGDYLHARENVKDLSELFRDIDRLNPKQRPEDALEVVP